MSISPLEETTSQGGRSLDEIAKELATGRVLESGPVVDFEGTKDDTSKAERALAAARKAYLANPTAHVSTSKRLMGINDDVVKEVGREIGNDADPKMVQIAAAYLRSKAPKGYFAESTKQNTSAAYLSSLKSDDENTDFTQQQIEEASKLLKNAYLESGEVTEAFAKTFYLGTQLMPEDARQAIWAVYVWCRRTDEIVDAPRKPTDPDMLQDLSQWEVRLERLFTHGEVIDVLDLPLLDIRIKYPNLSIQPFLDMIRGMLMDIPDLGQDRYDTWEQLHLYCYRVAGTVGLMSMPVFGTAPGYTYDIAKWVQLKHCSLIFFISNSTQLSPRKFTNSREPALSLGVAFQITNILRDVGEDATTRNRIYLPRQDMERFGVTEEQIFNQRLDDNYIRLMKFLIARARMYYQRAKRGVPMLDTSARLPVQSSLDCYGKILDKIEENGYDSLTKRAYVGKWEKMFITLFSWYRTTDVANFLPMDDNKSHTSEWTDEELQ